MTEFDSSSGDKENYNEKRNIMKRNRCYFSSDKRPGFT
jgi:hypothetical protein